MPGKGNSGTVQASFRADYGSSRQVWSVLPYLLLLERLPEIPLDGAQALMRQDSRRPLARRGHLRQPGVGSVESHTVSVKSV